MLGFVKCDSRLLLCISMLMLMLALRDIAGIEFFDNLVIVASIVSMMCLKYENVVYFTFFIFPIMCGVPGYLITFAYIILVFKGPKLRRSQIVPLIIVALLEIVNESFREIEGLYMGMLSFLSFTAVFFYFLNERERMCSVKKCLTYYGLGTVFTFVVIYSNMFIEYGLDAILTIVR